MSSQKFKPECNKSSNAARSIDRSRTNGRGGREFSHHVMNGRTSSNSYVSSTKPVNKNRTDYVRDIPRSCSITSADSIQTRKLPSPPSSWPTFYPGAASLFEELDKMVMIVLRDGRHLIGVMRSYDQYSNIILENTHERHFVGSLYGDIPLGLYIVRGDSIALMGEVDENAEKSLDSNQNMPPALQKVSAEEILLAQQDVKADSYYVNWDFGDQN